MQSSAAQMCAGFELFMRFVLTSSLRSFDVPNKKTMMDLKEWNIHFGRAPTGSDRATPSARVSWTG